jgi:hypothetical protein
MLPLVRHPGRLRHRNKQFVVSQRPILIQDIPDRWH